MSRHFRLILQTGDNAIALAQAGYRKKFLGSVAMLNYKQKSSIAFVAHLFLLVLAIYCPTSSAVLINTETTNLGGQDWSMEISVTNNDQASGINEFTLYFDETLFSNLTLISSPTGWDSLVVQPDALLGAGFFDSYSAAPLALGQNISGFVVGFKSLATNLPTHWAFDVYADNLVYLASGDSETKVSSVPESSSLLLMMLGLLALRVGRIGK